jgi:hypothetical protein
MYKVKVSICDDPMQLIRQTPGCKGYWQNYRFFVNDDTVNDADFWVIVTKGRRKDESCNVTPQNTILISGEPDSVYRYADDYVKQFGTVVAPSIHIKHRNKIVMQPALMWFLGVRFNKDGSRYIDATKCYDFYKNNTFPKTKLLSVICSNQAITAGHQKRIDFVKKLKERYGNKLDLFGKGFNDIEDKWDAVAPYKYHIVIENSFFPHYWTEKITDPFLVNSYPIYYGCPNINEYFPEHSYTPIDIDHPDEAMQTIDKVMKENYAEKYAKEMDEAKELVLEKHNICNLIAEVCNNLDHNATKEYVTIRNEMSFRNINKLLMLISRVYYKIKYR